MGWLFTHAPQLIGVCVHELTMVRVELWAIKQLCECVRWSFGTVHFREFELMAIPYQLHPFGTDVNVFHLAGASCVLKETLGGCCVDVDDVGLREWRPEFVSDIPDV